MKLHEYQAKKLFNQYGLPIPKGLICTTLNEVKESISIIGCGPWVIKCQVHAGGRGKSGGVIIVNSKEEIQLFAEHWFGKYLVTSQTNHIGQPVHKILVEAAIDIIKELYLGGLVDRSNNCITFIASIQGGVDIENVAKETPHCIHQIKLDPLLGPQLYQSRDLAFKLGLSSKKQINQFSKIFMGLATLFLEKDILMAEINPLVITSSGDLICLDGKLHVDSNALFRQPELCKMRDLSQEDKREAYAKQYNLNYIALNGNIGCLVNGAGLAMSTIDIVKFYGGDPANFLDVGGRVTRERVIQAFQIILLDKKVKVILVNIFGGIVCCDVIAQGILDSISETSIHIPIIVRLEGNNAEKGIQRLVGSLLNISIANNLISAAKQAIALVEGK